jgi:hypothetical protein
MQPAGVVLHSHWSIFGMHTQVHDLLGALNGRLATECSPGHPSPPQPLPGVTYDVITSTSGGIPLQQTGLCADMRLFMIWNRVCDLLVRDQREARSPLT